MKKQGYGRYMGYIVLGAIAFSVLFAMCEHYFFPDLFDGIEHIKNMITGGLVGGVSAFLMSRFQKRIYKENPELAKQARINETDERAIMIRHTAAYQMWYVTFFSLLIMASIFVALENQVGIWVTLGGILIHLVGYFVVLYRLSKKL